MNHLIICREYPPAPSGGIGTYLVHMARLLAESGETVHVIGQLWQGVEKETEEKHHGRLIIHRLPFEDWTSFIGPKRHPALKSQETRGLYQSGYAPQCFSWQAGLLAEHLIEQEGIDIIEAQEFEAPLYYLQLRRALGLGPKRAPACLIHLHSPSESIAHYNDWNPHHVYVRTAKRLEDYSIDAADALLCPSRYLARQVETHHGLADGSIKVIPYPCGDSPYIERDRHTWEEGTICYVGRLERRKGVIEWVDAAVSVAPEYPAACFEFVGANILGSDRMSVQEVLERRIPQTLKGRFRFRGEQKRSVLSRFLANARMSVVPSRWENFPNTCIEAMRSGLPVIVSPEGGMAEMIEDGRSGWVAENSGSDGLAQALRRALDTPWTTLAQMGRHASSAIRQTCDDKKILEDQLRFRREIVDHGPTRSMQLQLNLPWTRRPLGGESARRIASQTPTKGLAIVITCLKNGQSPNECLKSIDRQTQKPAAVMIVDDGAAEKQTLQALNVVQQKGWQVLRKTAGGPASAKNAAIEAILASGVNPLGFIFLGPDDRLEPGFVAACEGVLRHCREVGLVSCWARHAGKVWVKPCPAFPDQWLSNEAAPFSAIRTEALQEAKFFRSMMSQGYDDWDLCNAVMAAGWDAVTIPEILGSHCLGHDPLMDAQAQPRMRRALLERFPELLGRDAKDLLLLSESERTSSQAGGFRLQGRLPLVRMALRYPRAAAVHVFGKGKSKMLRVIGRIIARTTGARRFIVWCLDRAGKKFLPNVTHDIPKSGLEKTSFSRRHRWKGVSVAAVQLLAETPSRIARLRVAISKTWDRSLVLRAFRPRTMGIRVIRTRYPHWGAYSGINQFVRYLDRSRYRIDMQVVSDNDEDFSIQNHALRNPVRRLVQEHGMQWYKLSDLMAEMRTMRQCWPGWEPLQFHGGGEPRFGERMQLALLVPMIVHEDRDLTKRIDVIHYLDGEHSAQFLPKLIARQGKGSPKIIATYHQHPEILQSLVEKEVIANLDCVTLVSPEQVAFFEGFLPKDRIRVILHGIDTDHFRPAPCLKDDGIFRCITVGHYLRDYGIVREVAERMKDNRNIEFHIVSSRTTGAEGLPNVRVHKDIDDARLLSLYQESDILFLPLLKATANNALLEGMACGLPVVSTDLVSVRAYAPGKDVILITNNDPSQFVEAILRLVHGTYERQAMATAARKRAEELDWRNIVRQYEDLYSTVSMT